MALLSSTQGRSLYGFRRKWYDIVANGDIWNWPINASFGRWLVISVIKRIIRNFYL